MKSICLGLSLLGVTAALSGCQEPPEVRYETEHFEIATDFDAPVCAGTLGYLEDHLAFAERELGQPLLAGSKIRLYWLETSLADWCREGASGCFYPGTRVIFAEGRSITHEVVHALLNAEARTSLFVEEGLAELYSGVGARYYKASGEQPPVAELIWLTPDEYRDRELDYALAGHFLAWLEVAYGRGATQRLAQVVVDGGGPEQLTTELGRVTSAKLEWIEDDYGEVGRKTFRGLLEAEVPELTLDYGVDLSLACDDEQTMGPLPSGVGGMYRVLRFELGVPQILNLQLNAGADVRLDVIDTGLERKRGRTVDFFMPRPSDHLEHPRLTGDEARRIPLLAGTYLLYLSSPGYEAEQVHIEARLETYRVPALPPPPQ